MWIVLLRPDLAHFRPSSTTENITALQLVIFFNDKAERTRAAMVYNTSNFQITPFPKYSKLFVWTFYLSFSFINIL